MAASKAKKKLKPLIRIAAFDDGYFKPRTKTKTSLVGVMARLDGRIEGILHTTVSVDGFDATKNLIKLVKASRFKKQIYYILLSGINVAGFNVFDIKEISKKLDVPIIVVFRKNPNLIKFRAAIRKLPKSRERLKQVKNAGKIHCFERLHFQYFGCDIATAREIIKRTLHYSNLPEPIRIAHLIASGITLGESRGRP